MTNQEKLVTWGLLALIAYELWRPAQAVPAPTFQLNPTSPTPNWIQQYSFEESSSVTEATSDIQSLLDIPQGPGGSYQTNTTDYFNPLSGILNFCAPQQMPASSLPIASQQNLAVTGYSMPQPQPGAMVDIQTV